MKINLCKVKLGGRMNGNESITLTKTLESDILVQGVANILCIKLIEAAFAKLKPIDKCLISISAFRKINFYDDGVGVDVESVLCMKEIISSNIEVSEVIENVKILIQTIYDRLKIVDKKFSISISVYKKRANGYAILTNYN